MKIKFLIFILSVFLLSSCAKKDLGLVVDETPIVTIKNMIKSDMVIFYKECDQNTKSFKKLIEAPSSRVNYEEELVFTPVSITLDADRCYDFKAVDRNTEDIAGIQNGVLLPPKMVWVLK